MPLPDVLASEIDALRSIVRTADTISARYQGGNALGCLQNLRDYVELNHVQFESGSSRGVGEAARIPI